MSEQAVWATLKGYGIGDKIGFLCGIGPAGHQRYPTEFKTIASIEGGSWKIIGFEDGSFQGYGAATRFWILKG